MSETQAVKDADTAQDDTEKQKPSEAESKSTETTETRPKKGSNGKTKAEAKPAENKGEGSRQKKAKNSNGKPKKAQKGELRLYTPRQGEAHAVETGEAADVGTQFMIPISSITDYSNPRHEPEHLHHLGYILIGNPSVKEHNEKTGARISLVHMALSDNMDDVAKFVQLVEEHENVDRDVDPNADQSIMELARDIAIYDQLYPILVRKERSGKYTVIDGGRRITAKLYLFAKSKILRRDKAEDHVLFGKGVPKEHPPIILASEHKVGDDELRLRSIVANVSRKEFGVLQQGRVYHEMLQEKNPKTGKKFTGKEAAQLLKVPYGTFRNREALWRPYSPKTGKGLTDDDRMKVARGEMLVTAASRKALGEKHYSDTGKPSSGRNRGLPLSEMQAEFDRTAEIRKEYRKGIAFCMGVSYEQAVKESEKRIKQAEQIDLKKQKQQKQQKRNKKGKAA